MLAAHNVLYSRNRYGMLQLSANGSNAFSQRYPVRIFGFCFAAYDHRSCRDVLLAAPDALMRSTLL